MPSLGPNSEAPSGEFAAVEASGLPLRLYVHLTRSGKPNPDRDTPRDTPRTRQESELTQDSENREVAVAHELAVVEGEVDRPDHSIPFLGGVTIPLTPALSGHEWRGRPAFRGSA